MKKLEFETSKGRFVIVDGVGEDFAMDLTHMIICDEWFVKLSEITEEQASEIVDYSILKNMYASYNYGFCTNSYVYKTAIESLHSLLKSKGIYLYKNPAPLLHHTRLEAEQKTFYNPYIFKL